ncbi:MAG: 3-isopropylmalate dehydratase large subunit [Candidatus Micrarchaeia archaeon]
MGKTLLDKVWDAHSVRELAQGRTQLYVQLHYVHEVTSPQAFAALRERKAPMAMPQNTFATMDHVIPTDCAGRPFADGVAERMAGELEKNVAQNRGMTYFGRDSGFQGIVHVIGPELGITQPGMTVCCGDSHTCTHGALGCIAFGIGTSQVRDVLATQSVAKQKPKVRRIEVNGCLGRGVYAKDVALELIRQLGIDYGIGFAYEYAGKTVERMGIEERMTLCNMSIEAGAQTGYVNPDDKTCQYLEGRKFAPSGEGFAGACDYWKSFASDPDAEFDDSVQVGADSIEPMVTWGTNPGQSVGINECIPRTNHLHNGERQAAHDALKFMGLEEGAQIKGTPITTAFIGSCTNGRITDLREAAKVVRGRWVARGVRAMVVPGSQKVAKQARAEGLDRIFTEAGFEWRKNPGCSMCLAMNNDRLSEGELCASSSNRNFVGRQGCANARTMLMSPAMVAAAAVCGEVVDCRELM